MVDPSDVAAWLWLDDAKRFGLSAQEAIIEEKPLLVERDHVKRLYALLLLAEGYLQLNMPAKGAMN